jgi:hypothetical protein
MTATGDNSMAIDSYRDAWDSLYPSDPAHTFTPQNS